MTDMSNRPITRAREAAASGSPGRDKIEQIPYGPEEEEEQEEAELLARRKEKKRA